MTSHLNQLPSFYEGLHFNEENTCSLVDMGNIILLQDFEFVLFKPDFLLRGKLE